MTPDEQLAESTKYSSALRCCITEPRPGVFALWDYRAQLIILTEDWNEVLTAYRARPAYTQRLVQPRAVATSRAENTARLLAALAGAR